MKRLNVLALILSVILLTILVESKLFSQPQLSARWIRTVVTPDPNTYGDDNIGTAIKKDHSGNLIVGGRYGPGADHGDFAIVKYNQNGIVLWTQEWSANPNDDMFRSYDQLNALEIDDSSNIYASGCTQIFDSSYVSHFWRGCHRRVWRVCFSANIHSHANNWGF